MNFDPVEFGKTMGLDCVPLDGPTYWRRIMLQPYLNINGFVSGYVGPGQKTIIPSKAECRIDTRLVADQKTREILEKVRRHVASVDTRIEVVEPGLGAKEPSRTAPDHPAVHIVARAIKAVRGVEPCVHLCAGGSLANSVWPDVLGADHISVPYANADENNHSPNENLNLERFYDGIHVSAEVFHVLAEADARKEIPRVTLPERKRTQAIRRFSKPSSGGLRTPGDTT